MIIRIGIPSGIILATPLALLQLTTPARGLLYGYGIGLPIFIGLQALIAWACSHFGWSSRKVWLIIIGLGGFTAALLTGSILKPLLFPPFVLVTLSMISPWTALIAYTAAWLEIRQQRSSKKIRSDLLCWGLWASGYWLSWSLAIKSALRLYQSLPSKPPDCFIATAAAQAAPHFTRAAQRCAKSGTTYQCNDQVRHLKGLEIALLTVCPPLHRSLRKWYNAIGPILANRLRRCRSSTLANLVYITLKPAEWLTVAFLALLPGVLPSVRSIYPPGPSSSLK